MWGLQSGVRGVSRRALPVVGMTSLSLAVSAGSVGLMRVAWADPPQTEPTTLPLAMPEHLPGFSAKAVEPPTGEGEGVWSIPQPAIPDGVIPANHTEPAPPQPTAPSPTVPGNPWPPLPALPTAPVLPSLPGLPAPPAVELPAAPITIPPIQIPAAKASQSATEEAPWPRERQSISLPAPAAPASPSGTPNRPLPAVASTPMAPAIPVIPVSQLAGPAEPKISLPAMPSPLSVNPGPVTEPPRDTATSRSIPVAQPTTLSRQAVGDLPVIPSFMTVKSAVLGLALASSPTQGAPDKIEPSKDETKKAEPAKPAESVKPEALDPLKKAIEELRTQQSSQQTELKSLTEAVLGKKATDGATVPGLLQKLTALENQQKSLQEQLTKIEQMLVTLNSVNAQKPTETKEPSKPAAEMPKTKPGDLPAPANPAAPASKATLRLINEYPVAISMLVNNKPYKLEPGEVRTLEIPAGDYSYELVAPGSEAVKKSIKENDTMTLRIR